MCIVTAKFVSISKKSAKTLSSNSCAMMFKNDTVPTFSPLLKYSLSPNSNDDGVIKSLVDNPLFASHSHSKRKSSASPIFKMLLNNFNLLLPSSGVTSEASLPEVLEEGTPPKTAAGELLQVSH